MMVNTTQTVQDWEHVVHTWYTPIQLEGSLQHRSYYRTYSFGHKLVQSQNPVPM
jgi:hypothetical protein